MSGGFLVDVAALDQLITTLSEAAQRMHTANDRLRSASAADLGGGDLDHAAADFQDRWEYGIGKIGQASEQLTDSLRQARDLYEQTDQAIAGLFPNPGAGAAGDPEAPETPSPISRALRSAPRSRCWPSPPRRSNRLARSSRALPRAPA